MGIFMSMFFFLCFNQSNGAELVPIKQNDFGTLQQLSKTKSAVLQCILFDYNLCQTCHVGLPKLMKQSDSGVLIAITGVGENNRNKLAKKWDVNPNRLVFIPQSFRKTLPTGCIYFEISEKSEYCLVYVHSEIKEVEKLINAIKGVDVESDIILNFFEKSIRNGSYLYSITNPTQDFTRYNLKTNNVEALSHQEFATFYWENVYENECNDGKHNYLNKDEAQTFLKENNSGANLFYPVNLSTFGDTIYLAVQPLIVYKDSNQHHVGGIGIVLKIDSNLKILDYERIPKRKGSSSILGFGIDETHIYLGNYDDSKFIFTKIDRKAHDFEKGKILAPKKYKYMKYSGRWVDMDNPNLIVMQDYPIFFSNSDSLIDYSHYLGLRIDTNTLFRTKYINCTSDKEFIAICQVNRCLVYLKIKNGNLIYRRFLKIPNHYNSTITPNPSGDGFVMLYQTKEGYYSTNITF